MHDEIIGDRKFTAIKACDIWFCRHWSAMCVGGRERGGQGDRGESGVGSRGGARACHNRRWSGLSRE